MIYTHTYTVTLAYLFLGWQAQHFIQPKNCVIHETEPMGLYPELVVRIVRLLRSRKVGGDLCSSTSCHHFTSILLLVYKGVLYVVFYLRRSHEPLPVPPQVHPTRIWQRKASFLDFSPKRQTAQTDRPPLPVDCAGLQFFSPEARLQGKIPSARGFTPVVVVYTSK